MRGSEYTELTSIKSSYISEVETAIAGLEAAESQAAGLEANLSAAENGGMITSQLRASQIVLPSVMKLFDWRA